MLSQNQLQCSINGVRPDKPELDLWPVQLYDLRTSKISKTSRYVSTFDTWFAFFLAPLFPFAGSRREAKGAGEKKPMHVRTFFGLELVLARRAYDIMIFLSRF
jgi:hypothetical protein